MSPPSDATKRIIDALQEISVEEGKSRAVGEIAAHVAELITRHLLSKRTISDLQERHTALATEGIGPLIEELQHFLNTYAEKAIQRGKALAEAALTEGGGI